MVIGYLFAAVAAAAVAVFALQNTVHVSLRFLVWTLGDVPLAAVVLGALGTGVIAAGVPLAIARWLSRSRVRTLQAQVRQLETALAERDRALLAQRPPTR